MEPEVGEAGVGFLSLAMEGSALGIEVLGVSVIVMAIVFGTARFVLHFSRRRPWRARVVRTFLSWSLVVEIEGRWPWQAAGGGAAREES